MSTLQLSPSNCLDNDLSFQLNNEDLEEKLKEVQDKIIRIKQEKELIIREIQNEKLKNEVSALFSSICSYSSVLHYH